MRITLVAATQMEVQPLLDFFAAEKTEKSDLWKADNSLHILITGMGMLNTAAHLAIYTQQHDRDFYIDAGVCGAFNRNFPIGHVYQIISETYGDFGVENDDTFEDFFDLGFLTKKEDAFQYGHCVPIKNHVHDTINLPVASAITVNKVHGNEQTIKTIQEKYQADTENMEGLAFYYVLKMVNKPGIEIRAVSNYVEKRNKENWDLMGSVANLNAYLIQLVQTLRM